MALTFDRSRPKMPLLTQSSMSKNLVLMEVCSDQYILDDQKISLRLTFELGAQSRRIFGLAMDRRG